MQTFEAVIGDNCLPLRWMTLLHIVRHHKGAGFWLDGQDSLLNELRELTLELRSAVASARCQSASGSSYETECLRVLVE